MREILDGFRFSLAAPEGITVWVIFMLTLNGLIGIMAQPHILASVGTGKDEQTCRIGFFYGNFVKRFCTVGWALVGMIAAAMVAQGMFGTLSLADPEDAFGFACHNLLFPGSLGLLIASVMAANMSTCSAFMVDSGALFTEGLFRKHLVINRPDRYYLWVGRLSGFVVTMLGVFYAVFLIEKVLYSFLLTETLATFMGISILGGILWSRANRWGALTSLLAALATNFTLYYLRDERLDHWDADVFCMALLAGSAALVVVSLLTPPEPRKKTDSFFGRLQTPTDMPESAATVSSETQVEEMPAAGALKEYAERGQQSLFVNLLRLRKGTSGLGFRKAYRLDLNGFIIGWVLAGALLLGTWIFLNS
jgi:Na+/proline symporter